MSALSTLSHGWFALVSLQCAVMSAYVGENINSLTYSYPMVYTHLINCYVS